MMKPMKKFKITEADITTRIRNYLMIRRIFHWKVWQGPMSQPKGVSDIIGCYKGRFLAIEVKKPGGKLTLMQAKFLAQVEDAGGIAFVARSLDDVINKLK